MIKEKIPPGGIKQMMNESPRNKILVRLHRIEGQVRGIQRMIEEEADCTEIINQVSAVKSAINRVGLALIQNHAQDCIMQAADEKSFETALNETLAIILKMMK